MDDHLPVMILQQEGCTEHMMTYKDILVFLEMMKQFAALVVHLSLGRGSQDG